MHNDLIILTQLTQHSSGSSPHRHLHTVSTPFGWSVSLLLSLSLFLCSPAVPVLLSTSSLLPIPPLSAIYHLQVAFSQPPWWSSISLYFCLLPPLPALPPNSLALPSGYASFQLAFFSAPPISRSPLSLPAGYCGSGPNSCIPFARCLCKLPLHCRPLWDPWFTDALPWRL